jgi:hypothetical protein
MVLKHARTPEDIFFMVVFMEDRTHVKDRFYLVLTNLVAFQNKLSESLQQIVLSLILYVDAGQLVDEMSCEPLTQPT